jgi:hypothetical protein
MQRWNSVQRLRAGAALTISSYAQRPVRLEVPASRFPALQVTDWTSDALAT